jgi:N-acetylglucosaminyl-diphospho-decaprenol L-rhamnosyltransferase
MRASVLIVSWNARDQLARCLRSLDPSTLEIIVVDNASADGSVELVGREFAHVKLLPQSRNLGFAGGVNLARRHAASRYLLLLNPDARAERGAWDTLVETLDRDAGLGAAAGRLIDENGRTQTGFNVRRFPTLASVAADLLLIDHLWPDNPASRWYYARDLDPDVPADVDQPAAACLMVRAEAFDRAGGMDEQFHPAWFEDVDFCRRVHALGYRIHYEPRAVFTHTGGTARNMLGVGGFSRAYYRNLARYVRKHHGQVAELSVRGLAAAGLTIRGVAAALRGDAEQREGYFGAVGPVLFASSERSQSKW